MILLRAGSLFLIAFLTASNVFARWDKVFSTRDSAWIGRTLEIRSGHFFDEQTGMVGAGSSTNVPLIFLTSDGGASWSLAGTPFNGNGVVSSFFFRDRMNGFATVHKSSFPASSIWRTVDGGLTWTDITGSRTAFEHTCIYETSRALIVTSWDRTGGKGGFSTDGGVTWNEVFDNAADHSSNGIGFVDDLHGLVTMGPASLQPSGNHAHVTSDGGLTWRKVQQFNEAWSVYALKGTSTFFLAPEGDIAGATGDREIYRSDDYGQSFQIISQFPTGIQFVGHIDGKGKILYVQTRIQSTDNGLFRSDDLGATWKNVGGPSNIEDSRFVVTGCAGEVVYAFDNVGNVWKTIDGGDGTLAPLSSGPQLSLSVDTLLFGSLYCSSVDVGFTITNASCDSLTVDSIVTSGDIFNEFSVGTTSPFSLGTFSEKGISVTFQPTSSGERELVLRIKGKRGSIAFDTTIRILARNQLAPELTIPSPPTLGAGEELFVPIFIKPTVDTFSISQYRIHLRYDGDIVSPENLDLSGTHSENGSVQFTKDGENGMLIVGTLPTPVTETSDLTKPFVRIVMRTFLSRATATTIEIDSFGTPMLIPRCPDVALPQSLFSLDLGCGDSILSSFLRTNSLANIISARPNPSQGQLDVTIDVHKQRALMLDVLDATGNVVRELEPSFVYEVGTHTQHVALSNLPTGTYYLRLREAQSTLSLYPIVIVR